MESQSLIDPTSKWRSLLEEQEKSGQAVAKFCHENNLERHRFYYWRRKIFGIKPRAKSHFIEIPPEKQLRSCKIILPNQVVVDMGGTIDQESVQECIQKICGAGHA